MFKRRVFIFGGCSFVTILLLSSLYLACAYELDPLCFFHLPREIKVDESGAPTDIAIPMDNNMRIQAAGIINNYKFDSIILGSSMLENTSSAYCNKALGGIFVNISLSGSSLYERKFVLAYALREKKLKKVIYSLDSMYLNCILEHNAYPLSNWKWLYTTPVNFLQIFTYMQSKEYILEVLWGDRKSNQWVQEIYYGKKKIKYIKTPDRPNNFMVPYHMNLFGGIENWIANQDNKKGVKDFLFKDVPLKAELPIHQELKKDLDKETEGKKYVEENLFFIIEKNPDTMFYLVFPPYWRYNFADWRQHTPTSFSLHQSIIRYVVKRGEELGNVAVYGFEDCPFVEDISNYTDTYHYHPKINEYIVDSIKLKKHLLTSKNVENYLSRCEKLAVKFDFKALADDVKERTSPHITK